MNNKYKSDGYLERLGDLRLKCTLTNHVVPTNSRAICEQFVLGKKRTRVVDLRRREESLLKQFEPLLVKSKYKERELFCRITGRYVKPIEKIIVEHCSGKRFMVGEAKVEAKQMQMLDERDPKDEEEKKKAKKEEAKRNAEKHKENRMKELEERREIRRLAAGGNIDDIGDDVEDEEDVEDDDDDDADDEEEDDDDDDHDAVEEDAPKAKRAKR